MEAGAAVFAGLVQGHAGAGGCRCDWSNVAETFRELPLNFWFVSEKENRLDRWTLTLLPDSPVRKLDSGFLQRKRKPHRQKSDCVGCFCAGNTLQRVDTNS